MRAKGPALALALLLGAAANASSQTALRLTAHDEGAADSDGERDFWFEAEGRADRNPVLVLLAGTRVTVTLENDGELPHNVRFGWPIEDEGPLVMPNESATFSFRVPANVTGASAYWCVPHRVVGMQGTIGYGHAVPANETTPPPEERPDLVPGPGAAIAALVLVAASLFAAGRRR